MTYTETLEALSGRAQQQALAAHRAYLAGRLTLAELMQLLEDLTVLHNGAAQEAALQAVSATLSMLLERTVPTIPLDLPDDTGRLRRAVGTLMERASEDSDEGSKRIERFAGSEVYDSAGEAFARSLQQHAEAEGMDWTESDRDGGGDFPPTSSRRRRIGWRRGLHPDACELCHWLERDGYIYPPERAMHHHPGCRCQQIIVVSTDTRREANEPWRQRYRASRGLDHDPAVARRRRAA